MGSDTTNGGAGKSKNAKVKLALFGVVCFLLMLTVAMAILLGPVWDLIFAPKWKSDFNHGVQVLKENREAGEQIIKKAFADSEAAQASILVRMAMHRQYARALYDEDEPQSADEQIQAAIALAPKELSWNSPEADLLSHLYQDRGWESHLRYLKNPAEPNGATDQELSVAIAEKAFGRDHEQTVYKLATLGLIYADTNRLDQAHEIMRGALQAANTKALEARWFVYALQSRINGIEHEYRAACENFLLARSIAKDAGQRERAWSEFEIGLRQGEPSESPSTQPVPILLACEKFSAIDELANKLRKEQTRCANGAWQLDDLYANLESSNGTVESGISQRLFEYKKWLQENPHSVTARVSLAACYVDYAWCARGSGYSGSVTEKGWNLFATRLKQAKSVLDADPEIRSKCPRSFFVYSKVALGQGWPQGVYMKLVADSHKKWPEYRVIDNATCWFLLPRWYGTDGDCTAEKFIVARANEIPGPKGDERYAQMVWYISPDLEALFSERSPLRWPRVKSGFMQIFSQFPHSMVARIAYVKLALQAGDNASVPHSFDGFTSR